MDTMILEVAEKLKQSILEGRTFDAAQVKVIGLGAIRAQAGEHWPIIKERVRANALSFLQASLADGDLVIPCGDGFLIVYADSLAERDLAREGLLIQEALNAFYLGDPATADLRAEVSETQIAAHEMAHFMSGAPSESVSVSIDPQMQVRFLPAWDVAREAVTVFCATPEFTERGRRRWGYNAKYRTDGRHERGDFVDVDRALLAAAIGAAERVASGGERCLIGYSVHVLTLKDRAGRTMINTMLTEASEAARRYLVGRIAEVETGAPLTHLVDWVSMLHHHTRRVSIELHPSERVFDGLQSTRAVAIGFHAPPKPVDGAQRIQASIARWRLSSRRQGMQMFIDHLQGHAALALACETGVDFLTSERIWPATDRPSGVRAATRSDVLALSMRQAV